MRPLTRPAAEEIKLRPYQVAAVEDLRSSFRDGHRRLLLQAGTGSGKTIIAAEIIKNAVAKGKYILFLAHRRELIDQCSDKLHRFGVDHGVIMAGRERDMAQNVQVASVQTVWHRAVKSNKIPLPPVDLMILDECHRSLSKTYLHLIDHYIGRPSELPGLGTETGSTLLGMTATPVRGDGRGLGEVYEDMVMCPPIEELTKQGFLVPISYFAPSAPDLAGVRVRAGDYVEEELSHRMDKPPLIGSIVENWGRLAAGRPTIVFATGVKHSIHIQEEFEKAGVVAAHMDGNTPDDERTRILMGLWDGDIQVVTNCMVLTEGWDCPPVSCCILARPTKSVGLYLQMAGRTLRPWENKADCVLIDHAGAVYDHGFVDEEQPWDLDSTSKIQERLQERKKKDPRPVTCPECKAQFVSLAECPECGWKPKTRGQEYRWVRGELVEIERGGVGKDFAYSMQMKKEWWLQLIWIAGQKGYAEGWISHTFKKKFGVWPRFSRQLPDGQPPGPEVLAFVRHLQIKFAKGREARAKAAEAGR